MLNTFNAKAQVLNPNDPIVQYDPDNLPVTPPYDSIGKWVYTPSMGYNTSSYKCYYYKGLAFRLMFPKSWTSNSTKVYPMVIFLHGLGERGTIYDNELQLKWEGKNFIDAENAGKYDGFVMFPQSQNGFWGEPYYQEITEIINYMAKNVKLDLNQIHLSGLSAGGSGDWAFLTSYPKYFAGAEIISSSYTDLLNHINNPLKYIPIWLSQGGLDGNPAPYTSQQIVNALQNVGADITYTVYPDAGHGVWDLHYAEPDTYPWYNRKNKTNPIVFFGKTEFCPADTSNINLTLGLTPGFDGYEWRKNGIVIAGANSNTLVVTSIGTYDARIKRGSVWSYWSPSPAVIKVKAPTQTPDITVKGLMSTVLPAPDGNSSVTLSLPSGYASYQWQMQGSGTILGSQETYTTSNVGYYVADVTEAGGCSSNESRPFYVASANGSNPPDAAANPVGYALSQTQIRLSWSDNPNPVFNETGFEIYRGLNAGGPYKLVAINAADSLTYVDNDLTANTRYYYIIRAIDSTAAAPNSSEISVITQVDGQPPTAPHLEVLNTTRNSISIQWSSSTDNASISRYYVYVNGIRSYITTDTIFTINNLMQGELYDFYIRAEDPTGNLSSPSNQISAPAVLRGLDYDYYTFTGTWNSLPDFNSLVPVNTGTSSNIDIGVATQGDNFAFKWSGYIQIPKSGSYTFSTNSDDGSRLYINTPYSYSATPLVNNDGLHGTAMKSGTIHLNAGSYPITITYYEQGGGQVMEVYWQSTALNNNNSRTRIPDSAFRDDFTPLGNPPISPSGIHAIPISYKQINLTWNDNSDDESGFEVYRASSLGGPYNIIATTGSNIDAYSDSTCAPETSYYYKVQAINRYGSSGFNLADLGGLNYSFYQVAGGLSKLPNFDELTPAKIGIVTNITLDPRTTNTNFAFKFAGTISISVDGQYTFYTKSDDNSKLYIGGFADSNLVVNNDYLQGATERSGTIDLTAGTYPIYVTYMQQGGGYELTTSYKGPGISKQLIPDSVFANKDMVATTFSAPDRPSAPSDLLVVAASPYKVNLSWTSDLVNVSKFSVYRSVTNNTSYQFLKDVAATGASLISVSDSSLFANTAYYYRVQAKNVLDSSSSFSNEANATTTDNLPILESIGDQTMRYNTTLLLNVIASDPDGEQLTLSVSNLPNFATFQDYGDGTGLITINPSPQDEGLHGNIGVSVSDQHSGVSSLTFGLTVGDNYSPVISPIEGISMNAGSTYRDTLVATDQNEGDILSWDVQGLPSFAQFTRISNDSAVVVFNPDYENAGSYSMYVNVSDGNGGTDNRILSLSVNYVDPVRRWYLSFKYQTSANTPWNNIMGVNSTNLVDDQGNVTDVGLNFQTSWWSAYDGGSVTGNNSGVFPDNVVKDYYYFGIFGGPDSVSASVVGLTPGQYYDFTFFASSSWNGVADNGHTVFAAGSDIDSLYVQNNKQNTVTFNNLLADSSGRVTFSVKKGNDAPVGYLNAMIIKSVYTSNQPPATPGNFSVQNGEDDGVEVAWTPPILNTATGYEIYRATSISGSFTLINNDPIGSNDSIYLDTEAAGNTTYYYTMRAINQNGASGYTDTLQINTLVKNPVISAIEDIQMKSGDSKSITVSAESDPLDDISFSVVNLPSFASFEELGGGSGRIILAPQSSDIGQYSNISVVAVTNNGGRDTSTFSVTVTDRNVRRVNINFLHSGSVSAGIWNNVGGWGFAGTVLSNLVDDNGASTNFKITLLDQWSNSIDNGGHITYNNSAVVPDSIMTSYFFQSNNNVRRIQLSGLSPNAKYNFAFVSSSVIGDGAHPDYTTVFNINDKTVSIDGYRNTDKFAQINGILSNQNGEIIINVSKTSSSLDAILNAMIIEEIEDTSILLQPTNLTATAPSRSKVSLKWIDHNSNELGFKVYRASSLTGSYGLIATVGTDVSQYVDESVASNTRYFYKVQSIGVGTAISDFSNIASVTTPQYAVYMNFNAREAAAPSPWNNSNKAPIDGDVFSNLSDENGNPTGVNLKFIKNFENENNVGVITGNNSGIFPDLVMNGEYYLDDGLDTVILNVSGLNIANKYTFSFFGSLVNFGWNNTTLFLINGKVVGLNVSNNSTQTVSLSDISPDGEGNITIKMINANHCAYAILGAIVIYSHTDYDDDGNPVVENQMIMRAKSDQQLQLMEYGKTNSVDKILSVRKVYPNPFHNMLNIMFNVGSQSGETIFSLFDVSGRRVYEKNVGVLSSGIHSIMLNLSSYNLKNQMYILKIATTSDDRSQVVKVIHF